jgi:hypothetical protein
MIPEPVKALGKEALKNLDPLGVGRFAAETLVPQLKSSVKPALVEEDVVPPPPSKVANWLTAMQDEPDRNPEAFTGPGTPAGGAGGVSGSVEFTRGPQVPGELVAAQMILGKQHADLVSASHQARADAAGIAINLTTELAEGYRTNIEKTNQHVETLLAEAELEKDAIGELIEAAKSNRINPGQFFANIGEAGKFSAALAIGAGAMATAFGGGPNVAYQIIQRAIDRNVRAQVINMHHGRAMISHQTNFVNMIRGLSNDRAQYGNYVELGLTTVAQAEFGKVRATLAETDSLLAAKDVYVRLNAAIIDAQIRAITNSQARVTLKFKGMSQRMQALRIAGAIPQRQPGAAPAGSRAKKSVDTTTIPDKAIRTALGAEGGTFEDNLANSFVKQVLSIPRGKRTPQQKDDMLNRIDEVLDQLEPTDPHYADLILAKTKIEDISDNLIGNYATTTIPVRGYGNKVFGIKEPGLFKKKGKGDVINAFTTLSMLDSVHTLMGNTSAKPKAIFLRELGIADGRRHMSTLSEPEQARLAAKMKNLSTRLTYGAFMSLNKDVRNAMNRSFEVRMGEAVSGTGVSVAEFIGDYYRNDEALRKARVLPAIDEGIIDVQNAVHGAGLWMESIE